MSFKEPPQSLDRENREKKEELVHNLFLTPPFFYFLPFSLFPPPNTLDRIPQPTPSPTHLTFPPVV